MKGRLKRTSDSKYEIPTYGLKAVKARVEVHSYLFHFEMLPQQTGADDMQEGIDANGYCK